MLTLKLAEATISLANLYDGKLYDELAATTVKHLKAALELKDYDLPERFEEILHELESAD